MKNKQTKYENPVRERLKTLRERQGYSQFELAVHLGEGLNLVVRSESKTAIPTLPTLLKFSKFYELKLSDILKGLDEDLELFLNERGES